MLSFLYAPTLTSTHNYWKNYSCDSLSLSLVPQSCPILWPHGLQPARLLCPWDSPGKNTGVGCHFILQGTFLTQVLNLGLLHCRQILYQLSYEGSTHSPLALTRRTYLAKTLTFKSSVRASLVAQRLKRLPAMQETWVQFLGREDSLEKEMATHSSILAWRIPWTEEPGGLQSTGSQRVGYDWATSHGWLKSQPFKPLL